MYSVFREMLLTRSQRPDSVATILSAYYFVSTTLLRKRIRDQSSANVVEGCNACKPVQVPRRFCKSQLDISDFLRTDPVYYPRASLYSLVLPPPVARK